MQPHERLKEHLADASAEGQGIWQFAIHSAATIRQTYADARAGDAEAIEIALSFERYFDGVWRMTAAGPQCCIACPCVFNIGHLPAGLTVLAAYVERPHDRFVAGICGQCAGRADLKDEIVARCRETFGNARSIQLGAAGRA